MTSATPRDTGGTSRVAHLSLLAFTAIVGTVAFTLSFHGLDDYGRRVAGFGALSPLVPVAVDGLTLVAVAATVLLRNATWRIRAYAWLVFAVAVALSIGGNLAHAAARDLSAWGQVGAVASPVVLAFASHLVIVTRRTLEREDHVRAVAEAARQAEAEAAAKAERRAARTATPATPATSAVASAPRQRAATPHAPKTGRPSDTLAAQVRQMWTAGQSHAQIALALGISKKTAERHTEPLRQKTPADVAEEPDRAVPPPSPVRAIEMQAS